MWTKAGAGDCDQVSCFDRTGFLEWVSQNGENTHLIQVFSKKYKTFFWEFLC